MRVEALQQIHPVREKRMEWLCYCVKFVHFMWKSNGIWRTTPISGQIASVTSSAWAWQRKEDNFHTAAHDRDITFICCATNSSLFVSFVRHFTSISSFSCSVGYLGRNEWFIAYSPLCSQIANRKSHLYGNNRKSIKLYGFRFYTNFVPAAVL